MEEYTFEEYIKSNDVFSVKTRDVIKSVLLPIVKNLIKFPDNLKYKTLKSSNKKISDAINNSKLTLVTFKAIGFIYNTDTGNYTCHSGSNSIERLKTIADKLDQVMRHNEMKVSKNGTSKDNEKQSNGNLKHKIGKSMVYSNYCSKKCEDKLALEEVRRQIQQDRENKRKSCNELVSKLTLKSTEETLTDLTHLIPVAKKSIHLHERLRNMAFDAKHFTLKRISQAKIYNFCGNEWGPISTSCECPGEGLVAHWHTVGASIVYSYLVHLNSDATTVIHSGPVHGYQYNSLPGTDTFGKYTHTSVKITINGKVECYNPNQPATHCNYCNEQLCLICSN